jgi:hypothetical protein
MIVEYGGSFGYRFCRCSAGAHVVIASTKHMVVSTVRGQLKRVECVARNGRRGGQ